MSFNHKGWLPLLDVDHFPQAVLIREFYSNLSVHSTSSNIQFVNSWIRGEEYVITPQVVASALGVPLVQQPVCPYDETFPLNDIMSFITGTSIQWGTDPRITSHEFTELNYLFFQISCHSIQPISHLHTISIEKCEFLQALVTDASISFPTLFIRFLVEVHRSSSTTHGFFFPVFIHRILLHLGLEDFPTSELVHIIAPINATFLRQRVAQMRASSKRPKVKSSTGATTQPPSSGQPTTKEFVNLTAAVNPPPFASDDSSICSMLDTIMTVQATHGQLLVDVLTKLQVLHADLVSVQRSLPPPLFDDES